MALDNKSLEIIVDELEKEIVGSFLTKPLYLGNKFFAFSYTSSDNDKRSKHGNLVFSLDSTLPLITYTNKRINSLNNDSSFFSSLKKISYSRVISISKTRGERIVTISLKPSEFDLSEVNSSYDFVLELFANHPNCYIVAYPSGKIISLYKEYTNIEKGIFVVKNSIFSPQREKEIPSSFSSFEEAMPYLTNNLYRQISLQSNNDINRFNSIYRKINDSKQLYLYGKEILPYSFNIDDIKKIKSSDIYDFIIEGSLNKDNQKNEQDLFLILNKLIKTSEKKISNFISDLKKANSNLIYKEYGQLIYMYQGEIKKGSKELKTDKYIIPLDKNLDAPNNANKYFRKYQKAKTAIEVLNGLIEKSKEENAYFKRKIIELEDGSNRDIEELKSELLSLGYIKRERNKKHIQKVSKGKKFIPHFILGNDYKLGYGMNGLQNEELTFNMAKDNDLFFHVKDYPGAHVILFGRQDDETLLLGCELSLYLSHLTSGEVMVTKKKNVKKISSKIGLVKIKSYNSYTIKNIRNASLSLFENSKINKI